MPYLNIDDGMDEHPKVDALSDAAFRLYVSGKLAAGTPYSLCSLRPSRMKVTPPFSVTHARTGVIFMNA